MYIKKAQWEKIENGLSILLKEEYFDIFDKEDDEALIEAHKAWIDVLRQEARKKIK